MNGFGGRVKRKQREFIAAPTDAATSEGSSRLLDLPAELRNRIYEFVALDSGAVLSPRTRGKLAPKTALCRVSKQVRDELLAVLYVSALIIKAHVFDFDAHIVTFLNKLSERELSALPTLDNPTQRKLCVHIEVRTGCPRNPEGLRRWLFRCQHPTKKGTQIDVEYDFSVKLSDVHCHEAVRCWMLQKSLHLEKQEGASEDRICKELAKVVKAMCKAESINEVGAGRASWV